ncbi:hypothetical protein BOX15_Mlig022757g2, partial [Macrostomum lignano]
KPNTASAMSLSASSSQSSSPYTGHFAENFFWGNTLGEGGNSIVKLVYNPQTEQRMACKIFDSKDSMSGPGFETQRQDRLRQVRKEYMMLKLVESSPHENVCKFLGVRQAGDTYFMFFELLTGGELFNHIVPDVGIPASLAKMYFVQICRAIAHLQTLGIAHRDIKCENCLLTGDLRTLKVTDFGWATIYRSQQGAVRTLVGVAGTEPYMCPEMHVTDRPYRAEPVDYWSAGVVLIAMLTGEMPWDRAHSSEPHFVAWVQGNNNQMPFDRLTAEQLTFLRKLLCLRPSKRLYGDSVLQHPWIRSRDLPEPTRARGVTPQISSSQAAPVSLNLDGDSNSGPPALLSPGVFVAPIESAEDEAAVAAAAAAAKNPPQMTGGFTQPARLAAIPLGTATQAAAAAAAAAPITASQLDSAEMQPIGLHRMALRLTRFFTSTDAAATQEELLKALGMVSELRVTQQDRGAIHVTTTLPGTYPVSFKICLYLVRNSNILVEFRRTAGSGLQFSQFYQRLHSLLKHIISQDDELCGLLKAAVDAKNSSTNNAASAAAADGGGNVSFMDCSEPSDVGAAAAAAVGDCAGAQQVGIDEDVVM